MIVSNFLKKYLRHGNRELLKICRNRLYFILFENKVKNILMRIFNDLFNEKGRRKTLKTKIMWKQKIPFHSSVIFLNISFFFE